MCVSKRFEIYSIGRTRVPGGKGRVGGRLRDVSETLTYLLVLYIYIILAPADVCTRTSTPAPGVIKELTLTLCPSLQ